MLLLGVLVILLPRLPTKEPLCLCMDMLLVEEWSMEDKLNDLQLIVINSISNKNASSLYAEFPLKITSAQSLIQATTIFSVREDGKTLCD